MQECCQAWKADGPEIASAAKAPAAAQPAFPNRLDLLRAQRPRAVPAIPRPKPVPATPFDDTLCDLRRTHVQSVFLLRP